ncbi:Retrovirus-related Pol polyprotein from type-1 retrotransposable element R2 [Diplonema papillatum]|nr:Retrovirus-related Pol polyprotein from type-1 retrotransposable element R2 [Diplonema papillatum]
MLKDPTFEAHFAPSERYGSWFAYVEAMRGPYEYGDEMTLTAAATVTGAVLWVLDSRRPHILRRYAPRVGATGQQTAVTYVPEHYDRLLLPGTTLAELALHADTVETVELSRVEHAVRVAAHEGTDARSQQVPPKRDGGVLQGGRETLKFGTINMTSLGGRAHFLDCAAVDILAVQETLLTDWGQREFEDGVRRDWKSLWGEPCRERLDRQGKASPWIAEAGGAGVAVFAKKPAPAFVVGKPSPSRRWVHVAVGLGRGNQFLHVFTLYANSGDKAAPEREKIIAEVHREAASLGRVPVIVAGDFNAEPSSSAAMSCMLRSGWYDAAEICTDGGAPKTYEKTGTRGTRIDHVLLNDVAIHSLVASETTVVVDAEGQRVPSHKMVTVELDITAFADTCERYRMPRSMSQVDVTHEGRAAARAEELLVKHRFEDAAPDDVEALWVSATKACEGYLVELAEKQGLLDGPVAAYQGRGETRKPKREHFASVTDTGTGAGTYASSRFRKILNGLDAYIRGLQTLSGEGPGCMPRSLEKTWENVVSGLESMAGRVPKVRDLPRRPPDLSVAQTLRQKLEARSRSLTAQARKGRIAQLESKMQNFHCANRAQLLPWCRRKKADGLVALKVDGRYTANLREIDATLQKEWAPINRMYASRPEPCYEAFKAEYAEYIRCRPMVCRDLTGDDLRSVLGKKQRAGVPGVDGWSTAELKKLPLPLLNALAKVFNAIEATGTWPNALLEAAVTLIPKDETLDPLALRPITVTSAVYRLWASTRLRDVVQWQEGWIADSQHGFRPKHGTVDVVFEIASQIEEALLTGKELYGVALDFAKCFDKVPRDVVLKLVGDLGLHERILGPLRDVYARLRRRYKLHMGLGDIFYTTNGILQGCPLSVILINALLSIVVRRVDDVGGVTSESFADDLTLLTRLREACLQDALVEVDRFCANTGMSIGIPKTFAFGTPKGYEAKLKIGGTDIVTKEELTIVGCLVGTKRTRRTTDLRYDQRAEEAERLGALPISRAQRSGLAAMAVLPAATYGSEFALPTVRGLGKFTAALLRGVWDPVRLHRAQEAVLGILNKAHMLDPYTVLPYRSLGMIAEVCRKRPVWRARVATVRRAYGSRIRAWGPIGIAAEHAKKLGIRWTEDLDDAEDEAGNVLRLVRQSKGERGHTLRKAIHGWRLGELEKRRTNFGGVRAGVDYTATNAYGLKASTTLTAARDVAEVVAGSVMTESHAAKLWGGDGLCRRCDEATEETLGHIWWQCRAYERIRMQQQYAEIVDADRSTWPPCLQEHGILPKGSRINIEVLHTFMAEVMQERRRLEREGRDRAVGHPWRQLHPDDCPPRRLNFEAIAGPGTFTAVAGERWFRALQYWLDGMCWSVAGDVSTAELAVDFEVYTGLDLPGSLVATTGGTPLCIRARMLARMLKTIGEALERKGVGPLLPGRKLEKIGSLRTVGAPPCLTGYEMRPIFRGGEETMGILETQLKASRHAFTGEAWGMDLFPTYGRERAERAARWAAFDDTTEKRKGKKSAVVGGDPWLVPEGIPRHEKWGERVCPGHQKVKCDVCKRRGKSVAWCCQAHHREGDGLAVKMCAEHRMTQCATCKTTAECCRNHHHRCLDHGMPTCDGCKKHADLRSRRPGHCCRKGHHRAAVARGEETTAKKRKAEPEGPAPAPRQAKRENVVLVLPEAEEDEREPATSTPTSAAKVGKTAPTPAKKRQSDSAAEPVPKRRKGRVDAPRPSPRRWEKAEIDAQPMNLDEQSKKKRSTKRAPERDDQDELKRRKHDTSRAKR